MVVRKPVVSWRSALCFGALLGGCSGAIGTGESGSEPPGDGIPGQGEGGQDGSLGGDEVVAPGQMPESERCRDLRQASRVPVKAAMRRLSWQEIQNALSDLFPQTPPSEFDAQTEPSHLPSRIGAALEINESFIRTYRPGVATLAARAAQSLTTNGVCKGGAVACLGAELEKLARRAWRGTLLAEDRVFLSTKLAAFTAEIGASAGYSAAVQLVLASPRFLFLTDPGSLSDDLGTDGVFAAKGERLAGLWAAAIWGSVPDDTLLNAAASGALEEPAGRAAELDRLLADTRARRGLSGFFRSWLHYNQIIKSVKNEQLFPGFTDDVRKEMLTDTENTLLELVFDEQTSPAALLTSPLGTPGARTVALLGWSADNVAARRGDLAAVGRHGVATHPALLAVTSKTDATSIVNRGRFVVEKLACGHVPDPPKDVDIDAVQMQAEAGGKASGRQLAERHATDPSCGGCHKFMDPFGMAFENFDPVGRQRTEDQGFPIDTSVELDDALGITGKFSGAAQLLDALAATGHAERCFATSLSNFVMPMELTEAQACAVTELAAAPDPDQPRSMLEVTKAFLLSDTFLTRTASAN